MRRAGSDRASAALPALAPRREADRQALRWRDVDLIEGILRVRDSKSEDGIRSIALSKTLAEELWQHRRRSNFQGDDEYVFCHPERGTRAIGPRRSRTHWEPR